MLIVILSLFLHFIIINRIIDYIFKFDITDLLYCKN